MSYNKFPFSVMITGRPNFQKISIKILHLLDSLSDNLKIFDTSPFLIDLLKMEYVNIPAGRRELYLSIIDTYSEVHFIAHRLHFLNEHFPLNKLDYALAWLISAKFTGAEFVMWFKYTCKGSDLEMQRILIAIIDKLALAPVVAGQNFRS